MKKIIVTIGIVLISSSWVQAQAQEVAPPNGLSEIAAYSLYLENYRAEQYNQALKYGRWIVLTMPQTIENYPKFNLANNLGRFVQIYANLAKTTNDPELKAGYVDTVQMIYDKVFNEFSEDQVDYYNWYISKGRFYADHAELFGESAASTSIQAYQKAFAMNPEKMAKSSKGYYIRMLINPLIEKDTDQAKQEALAIIEKTKAYAGEDLLEYFDDVQRKLFDEPAERIAFLEDELQEDPQNVELLTQLRNLYKRQGDTQKVLQLNQKLYELDPSYQTITALANAAVGNANYDEAVRYLQEALELTDDPENKKIIYLNLAEAQLNLGNLSQAQDYAKQAIGIDSNFGRPYITLATIYARAVNQCTSGRELTPNDRAVYWVVLDYANRAKRVDSSVTSRANTLLQTYRPVTPTDDDIFFKDDWEKGQTITIDGSMGSCYSWINESTTVR